MQGLQATGRLACWPSLYLQSKSGTGGVRHTLMQPKSVTNSLFLLYSPDLMICPQRETHFNGKQLALCPDGIPSDLSPGLSQGFYTLRGRCRVCSSITSSLYCCLKCDHGGTSTSERLGYSLAAKPL